MELIANINVWEMFTNLRDFFEQGIGMYQNWFYAILFLIIFMETGFVVTPFLPGDSLLFISGYFASQGRLDLAVLLPVLCLAPILGDSTNYWVGRVIGPKIFHKEKVRFLNKEYLNRAHAFYGKHGGKAVAIGRFLPIIRTFVPFVAGIGKMRYGRFLGFSVVGTLAWIHLCILAGHQFGGIPFVQKHFEMVVIAIIVISLIPAFVAFLRNRKTTGSTTKSP
jgi:membrane-associated protein